MSDDPLRLDEADADLAAGRARPSSEVFAELGLLDATAWETVREALDQALNQRDEMSWVREHVAALEDFASLQAAYEAMERELSELGLRNAELRRRLRDAERERDTALEAMKEWNEQAKAWERKSFDAHKEWRKDAIALDAAERELASAKVEIIDWKLAKADSDRERDALQHIIDCADTPLMRDVLREREELEAALREIEIQSRYAFPGYEDTPYAKINAIARAALASGKDKP